MSDSDTDRDLYDDLIRKCVDDIWKEHDKDNYGFLNTKETRKFVKHALADLDDPYQEAGGEEFSEENFRDCFAEMD